MCLGIPLKIVWVEGGEGMAESDGALRRKINLSMVKDVKAGDYVLVHAGFAMEKVKKLEAKKTLKLLRDYEIH